MKRTSSLMLAGVLLLLLASCTKKEDPVTPPPPAVSMTCIGCHGNEATLKAVADPNPPSDPGEGGCGGTLPEMEAWQKVYVGGPNGQKFLASTHGKLKCVDCHGGVEPAVDKKAAHTGTFVGAPSKDAQKYCGTCHAAIAAMDKTNIHTSGSGQKHMVALRGGFPSYDLFPTDLKKGYDTYCGKCHASCGECHVQRPKQAGGGFLSAHNFEKAPDMRLNCTACHSARVANAYFGEAFGTRPDIHYTKIPGGACTNCHSGKEMHGDGTVYTNRYNVKDLPQCVDCHAAKSKSNSFHTLHWDNLSCYTCHSQTYQNCGSCHVSAEGVRNGPYFAFKIGMNAMPQTKTYKFAVVRNAPFAPDTWDKFGVPTMSNFAAAPTFKLASPHNIQRWTERTKTEAGKPCYDACHIVDGRNKQWFLFQSDLQPFEVVANQSVIVDGKLPASWK